MSITISNYDQSSDQFDEKKPRTTIVATILLQLAIPLVLGLVLINVIFGNIIKKELISILSLFSYITVIWIFNDFINMKITLQLLIGSLIIFYTGIITHPGIVSFQTSFSHLLIGFSIWHLASHDKLSKYSLQILFVLISLPFAFSFFILGNRLDGGSTLFKMNRNTIPVIFFTLTCLISATEYIKGIRNPIIWPACISLIFTIFSLSRAGLLINTTYLLLVIMIRIKHYFSRNLDLLRSLRKNRRIVYIRLISIVIGIFVSLSYIYKDSRFASEGIRNNGRLDIYREFFDNLTIMKFLFGSRYGDYSSTGLHNTFLTFYAYLGLFSIIIMIMFLVSIINFCKKKHYLLLGILFLFIVYSSVETLSPFFIGDFLLIPLLVQGISGQSVPSQ